MRGFLTLAVRLRRRVWKAFNPVTLGVRLILMREGKVLLVQHSYDEDWWCLPGGGVIAGETLEQAARREAQEELGAELGDLRLEGVFSNFREGKSDHVAVFSCPDCVILGRKNLEIADWGFFDPAQLPAQTFPGHRRRVQEYFEGGPHPRAGVW